MELQDQSERRRTRHWPALFTALLALFTYIPGIGNAQTVRWDGHFAPCPRHGELLKHDAMTLGVKISTSSGAVRTAFERAMDFWSTVVDMTWYEDDGCSCAINVVDGTPAILSSAAVARSLSTAQGIAAGTQGFTVVARSQMPESGDFEGWVAFNAHVRLPANEMYMNAVHEIGHLLGLEHSQNPRSVMYFVDAEGADTLDSDDLARLASRHKLRTAAQQTSVPVTRP